MSEENSPLKQEVDKNVVEIVDEKVVTGSSICSDTSNTSFDSDLETLTREKVNKFLPVAEIQREGLSESKSTKFVIGKGEKLPVKTKYACQQKGVDIISESPNNLSKDKGNEDKTKNDKQVTKKRKRNETTNKPYMKSKSETKSPTPSKPEENDSIPPPNIKTIKFQHENQWHGTYVRTRHKNIRCFPFCLPIHRERSFCGQSLVVSTPYFNEKAKLLVLLGCFRKAREKLCFDYGSRETESNNSKHSKNALITAIFTGYDPVAQRSFFEFRPPRKWCYHCEQNKYTTQENHVFTLYVFEKQENGNLSCIGYTDSPAFCIVSAWNQSLETVSRPFASVPPEINALDINSTQNKIVNSIPRSLIEYHGQAHQRYPLDSFSRPQHIHHSADTRVKPPNHIPRSYETNDLRYGGRVAAIYERMHEGYSNLPHEDVVLHSYQQYGMKRHPEVNSRFRYGNFPSAPDPLFPAPQERNSRPFPTRMSYQSCQPYGGTPYNYSDGYQENNRPRRYPQLSSRNTTDESKRDAHISNPSPQTHYYTGYSERENYYQALPPGSFRSWPPSCLLGAKPAYPPGFGES